MIIQSFRITLFMFEILSQMLEFEKCLICHTKWIKAPVLQRWPPVLSPALGLQGRSHQDSGDVDLPGCQGPHHQHGRRHASTPGGCPRPQGRRPDGKS